MGSTVLGTIVTPHSSEYVAGSSGNLLTTGAFSYEQATPGTCLLSQSLHSSTGENNIQINEPIIGSDVFQWKQKMLSVT